MLFHIRNFIILSRPLNVIIAIATILIAALVSGNFQWNEKLLYACLTAGLITCGANIINDIFDVEIDRINKPGRSLPSGKITIQTATIYFIISYSAALVFAVLSGWRMMLIAIVIAGLLFSYSAYFKRTVLWGNIIVSFSSAVAFVYGAMAVGDWRAGIIPLVFAFLFHFGREIIKDMQDLKGDLSQKAITFPGKFGITNSALLVTVLFLLLVGLTFVPYIFSIYNLSYLIIVLLGVDSVLISVSIMIWFRRDEKTLGKVSHLLKLDMFVGLLCIYIGAENINFIL